MLTAQNILLVLLIGVIAQATNTELANNTNFLLLLLLALGAYNQNGNSNGCGCGNCNSCCSGVNRSFI